MPCWGADPAPRMTESSPECFFGPEVRKRSRSRTFSPRTPRSTPAVIRDASWTKVHYDLHEQGSPRLSDLACRQAKVATYVSLVPESGRPLPRQLSRQRLHHGVALIAGFVQNQRIIRRRFGFRCKLNRSKDLCWNRWLAKLHESLLFPTTRPSSAGEHGSCKSRFGQRLPTCLSFATAGFPVPDRRRVNRGARSAVRRHRERRPSPRRKEEGQALRLWIDLNETFWCCAS